MDSSPQSQTQTQPARPAVTGGGCRHRPRCPGAWAENRHEARTVVFHPEQGWGLRCNGLVFFTDGGCLAPGGTPEEMTAWHSRVAGRRT
jgi:hypothetical protein